MPGFNAFHIFTVLQPIRHTRCPLFFTRSVSTPGRLAPSWCKILTNSLQTINTHTSTFHQAFHLLNMIQESKHEESYDRLYNDMRGSDMFSDDEPTCEHHRLGLLSSPLSCRCPHHRQLILLVVSIDLRRFQDLSIDKKN